MIMNVLEKIWYFDILPTVFIKNTLLYIYIKIILYIIWPPGQTEQLMEKGFVRVVTKNLMAALVELHERVWQMGETYRRTNITATPPPVWALYWCGQTHPPLSEDTWKHTWHKSTERILRLWETRLSGLMDLNSKHDVWRKAALLITCRVPHSKSGLYTTPWMSLSGPATVWAWIQSNISGETWKWNVCLPHPTWLSLRCEEMRRRMADSCQMLMSDACPIIP